ncbi:four-carbon acid sugar kinase family protein [Ramlibacter sp. XY19]|uniref:four-carbon acid sugar kinase family protein n=1 Tax=Ramlibacter paludis TaxID=2908000 RepID=UPI0023DA5D87|nr:four-carbon acid sugar kinase family protein [Ramlibacter paludis]MCG2594348.1 four-carbon acid sugar kinase family protein [Ramlibacter paludis]
MNAGPRIGWYGDDFTGATDTLAVLTQAGLRAMLFLGVPSTGRQAAAEHALGGALAAVGIAGAARSMDPAAMERELEPVGAYFASLRVPVLHYKVCSTFDSAPGVGNIAVAARVLRKHVANDFLPIVGGQPSLGRYCVFSNLFAAAGRGGTVERIDRHPTMRNHPSTPMAEADLRQHLALQGLEPVAAVHYPSYAVGVKAAAGAVLLDVASDDDLPEIGRLLWDEAQRERLLAIGASSVAQALIAHWRLPVQAQPALPPAQGPVLVLAGSLSPVTARQVQAATSFQRFQVSPAQLLDEASSSAAASSLARALREGRNVLAVTAPPEGSAKDSAGGAEIAQASARFLRQVLRQHPLRRIGIAGGDTSSLAVQGLGAWGLSYAGALGPGVALSRVHHDEPALDGLVVMLKGGQMGSEDVFEQLAR